MASKTSIINQALGILANARITGESDTSERAQTMLEQYQDALDAVLSDHPWNFAMHFATLAPEVDTPAHTWGYQYLLPTNPYVLAVWEPKQIDIPWQGVGRRIFTNKATSLDIAGTVRITDSTLLSPLCADALAAKLAMQAAYSKTRGAPMFDRLKRLYLERLNDAESNDGRQGQVQVVFENTFTGVRR